ncbi:hypothetical protein FN846DRAFT_928298 [Sphaerosporella brunnea]|uniref:F-box domain-containing protein n=1 Tax=Sphaerosporella brunnea TaxID=1250544 RepID=A0A5J5FA97_9PEZI|nr:hypothetical protein FN846DRAFT_928298 [Sphaerosporella brunnea]
MTSIGLLNLPPEIHLEISNYLSKLSKYELALTSRYFRVTIGPITLTRAEAFSLRLEEEQSDPARYCRVCSKCVRLLPFWNFSHKHAGARTKPVHRLCLDCFLNGYDFMQRQPQLVKWFFGLQIAVCHVCRQLVRCHDAAAISTPFLPHNCSLGVDPNTPVVDGSAEPSIRCLRTRADRLEAKLPRSLLDFRSDKQSVNQIVRSFGLESIFAHLEHQADLH